LSSIIDKLVSGFLRMLSGEHFADKTVLDAGCGYGIWGHILRSLQVKGGLECYIVGCDIWKPYLEATKKYSPYDDFVLCDVRKLPFRNKSFNYVISFEILEHFSKKEGKIYLNQLKLLSEKIIVSTPLGFYPQGVIDGNEFQAHKSAWQEKDFREVGYDVYVTGLGSELEYAFRKFRLLSFFRKLRVKVVKEDWTGAMLVAKSDKIDFS
jgi:SAM-dependent methyltransferase